MLKNFLRYSKIMLDNGHLLDSDQYNIEFEVERTADSKGNSATIILRYINESTKQWFKQKGQLQISAGYKEGLIGLIFNGVIERLEEHSDTLEIFATESNAKMRNTVVNESFTPDTLASTIVKKLIQDYNFKIGKIDIPNDYKYYGGRYFTETFKESMDKIASDTACIWYEKKGLIYFHPKNSNSIKTYINANAGLLEFNKKDANKYTMITKLNHTLDENATVEVEFDQNKKISVIIKSVSHSSSDFTTICEVIDPSVKVEKKAKKGGGQDDGGDFDWL